MTSQAKLERVSARLAAIAESATLAVDAKAKALKAKGENVIGFGAGEPDFPTPAHIVEAAAKACYDVKNHRYTPAAGLPELREAIAVKTLRDSGFTCKATSDDGVVPLAAASLAEVFASPRAKPDDLFK
jgi:aspartate/methionine/tyrosine aminotransferase